MSGITLITESGETRKIDAHRIVVDPDALRKGELIVKLLYVRDDGFSFEVAAVAKNPEMVFQDCYLRKDKDGNTSAKLKRNVLLEFKRYAEKASDCPSLREDVSTLVDEFLKILDVQEGNNVK